MIRPPERAAHIALGKQAIQGDGGGDERASHGKGWEIKPRAVSPRTAKNGVKLEKRSYSYS